MSGRNALNNPLHYHAFGLTIATAIPFAHPPPLPAPPEAPAITISEGAVPASLPDPVIRKVFSQVRGKEWLITAERITGARFLVRDGQEVIVGREEGLPRTRNIQLFLQGACMGALLLQRGRVTVHGSVLAGDRGAIVLAGAVGAGKSTLTLALLRRGYRLLSDDLCAISVEHGDVPMVQPGFPHIKLWADTCERFGIESTALPRIRPELEKYYYPVGDAFCETPQPLRAIYILYPETRQGATLEPLAGVARLTEVQAQLYKMRFKEAQRNWPWLFRRVSAIARQARVYLLRRPETGFSTVRLADLISGT